MATLLSICRDAADRCNQPRPSQIYSGVDQTARTFLGCAQREGTALARRWAWQALLTEKTFTSTATTVQATSVPSDWDGRMVADTLWNRTQKRRVRGPLSSDEWQALQASGVNSVTDAFRFRDNLIELVPTPTAGWTYAYEYISSHWCESSTGTGQAVWAADTDVARLDAELLTLGVAWRFLRALGMDHTALFVDYEDEVLKAIARDGSRRVVHLAGGARWDLPMPITQEGSWPL